MPKRISRKLDREALEKVSNVFRAFSEPTRLQIIQELKDGPKNVTDLVTALGTSQANVSKQLRILYEAEILQKEKKGTMIFYSIDDDTALPLCELVCQKLNRQKQRTVEDYTI